MTSRMNVTPEQKAIDTVNGLKGRIRELEERVARLERFESAFYRASCPPEAKEWIKKLIAEVAGGSNTGFAAKDGE